MKIAPKISVVVPCYNVQRYISQCINSLLCQTLYDIEIIAVDDGSTDGTGEILDRFGLLDGRITVVHQPNGGYGKAMNAGLERCRGDYVGILESDDFCDPTMFASLYSLCSNWHLDMAKCDFFLYWSEKDKCVPQNFAPDYLYNRLISPHEYPEVIYGQPSIWSAIYRRDMLVENDINFTETPGASYQDTAFNIKVWCCAKTVWLIPNKFVWYRQDNESSSTHSKDKVYNVCFEYDEAMKFARIHASWLMPHIERMRFEAYRWNFTRIAKRFRPGFVWRMRKDLKSALAEGIVDESLYFEHDLAWHHAFTKHPGLFQIKKIMQKLLK